MNSLIKKCFSDSAIYLLPSLFSRGLSVFLIPVYTRVLQPSDYGVMDFIALTGAILNIVIPLDITQSFGRYYKECKTKESRSELASTTFWFVVIGYTISSCFLFNIFPTIGEVFLERRIRPQLNHLAILYFFSSGVLYTLQNHVRWSLRSKVFAKSGLIQVVVTAIISVYFTFFRQWKVEGMLLGLTCGMLVSITYISSIVYQELTSIPSIRLLSSMLAFCLPLVPATLIAWCGGYLDRILIKTFLSVDDLGIYGLAFRLGSITNIVMVGFQSATAPLIMSSYKDPDTPDQLAKLLRYFTFLVILIYSGMSLFAESIVRAISTDEYIEAAGIIVVLIPGMLLSTMTMFAPGITIAKKTKYFLGVTMFALVIDLVVAVIAIPLLGINGASLGRLVYGVVYFCSIMYLSQRFYPVPHSWRQLAGSLISMCFLVFGGRYCIVVYGLGSWFQWLCLGALTGILLIWRLITIEELGMAWNYIRIQLKRIL